MTIKLSLKEMLPTIRKAFDNKELQMFKRNQRGACLYTGPCAIGVCLTPEEQKILDNGIEDFGDSTIDTLYDNGVVEIDANEFQDIVSLQELHDSAVSSNKLTSDISEYNQENFKNFLEELEEKYPVQYVLIDILDKFSYTIYLGVSNNG